MYLAKYNFEFQTHNLGHGTKPFLFSFTDSLHKFIIRANVIEIEGLLFLGFGQGTLKKVFHLSTGY